ncbi:NUDIX domain-containing protein [Microbacterium sp. NPDC058342]|uniref:NUDIX domain-containing protein n=1 Tax=Microbacterium sp. NPDC058342 TaxID=3346454 RepID=UPI003649C0E1
MPEVVVSAPPSAWRLSAEGTADASALMIDATTAVSSPETKAVQTAALALHVDAAAIIQDMRFREVDREEQVHYGFREARRAWVSGRLDARHDGWETPDAAAHRFHMGLLAHSADHLIVGTHGMVLTAWMVSMGLVAAGDAAVGFWEGLGFPDVIDLDIPLPRVRAVLTDAEGRYLVIKRTRPGQAPYWTAPGGGVALTDASIEDALQRELREELGAEAEIGQVLFERMIDGIRSEIFCSVRLIGMDLSLRSGPELADPTRGTYDVEFVARSQVSGLDLRPVELKRRILADSSATYR